MKELRLQSLTYDFKEGLVFWTITGIMQRRDADPFIAQLEEISKPSVDPPRTRNIPIIPVKVFLEM